MSYEMKTSSGLNDEIDVGQCVTFDLKAGFKASVVISLAKWKVLALKKYGFGLNEGLYADMNAIRKYEYIGPLHSYYVAQWVWEKIIKGGRPKHDIPQVDCEGYLRVLQDHRNAATQGLPEPHQKNFLTI
ncbi:hypothetical protein JTE90_000156 [Oedothorax gibbosus]|uniref:Uncharacterized protein n=1 Tax=Oedothorax gibbosus TaxID=931172 RepID=A0AAV6TKL0_9ARAC|nr:hypothetical protein JTE90_000156 [Oedothorax gibbosus]